MKRIIIPCLLIIAATGAMPTEAAAQQHDEIDRRGAVSIGADEVRSRLLSYNDRLQSLSQDTAGSIYIQTIDREWKVRRFAEPSQVDTTLVATGADLSGWQSISLPDNGATASAATIYRNEFNMPFRWIDRQIILHLGPAGRAYYVYVNGKRVGYHEDSSLPAEFDITGVVEEGKNHLGIVAYSQPVSATLENQIKAGGTTMQGDIYIMAQPKVRMRDWVVDTRFDVEGSAGLLNLGVIVKTHLLNTKAVNVYYELMAPDGSPVTKGWRDARFDMKREDTVRFFANIPDVQSWSHESPKLYTVALKIQHEGRFTEYTAIKVGFREVSFGSEGLFINGKPVVLNAMDYTPAVDSVSLVRDLSDFRRRGVNLLKVTNYPQNDLFYRMTDIYGIYVCDQANIDSRLSGSSLVIGGTPANDTVWERAYAERVMNMYHFSKNHPSVVMFSLGGKADRGYNLYEAYLRMKEAESARPVIYEGAGAEWNTDMVVGRPAGRNATDRRYTVSFGGVAGGAEQLADGVVRQSRKGSESPSANRESGERVRGNVAAGSGKVTITGEEGGTAAVITNNFRIVNLNNFDVRYEILNGSKVIAEGALPSNIAPGASARAEAPTEGLKPGKYTLQIAVTHKEESPFAKRGEVLGELSQPLRIEKEK